jgi:hypothetical protein
MLRAERGGAEGECPGTIPQSTMLEPSWRSRGGLGGKGIAECHSGDAETNNKIAGSNFDSCEHTEAHPGTVGMEAKKGRAESAKPRSLACGSETVDTEWGDGCINVGSHMHVITDPQLGEPKISKEYSEHQSLKREYKLAESGVLEVTNLRGNEKQVSQEPDIPLGRPLVEAAEVGAHFRKCAVTIDEQFWCIGQIGQMVHQNKTPSLHR